MKHIFSTERFEEAPVMGILRGFSLNEILQFIPSYIEAGLQTVEVTMNSPKPADAIQKLVVEYGDVLNIGAGTVCSKADLERAITAGASFIVAPNTNEAIITGALENNLAVIPGAFTPTEIAKARELGATAIKLFPASGLSPAFVKDMLGPFPDARLIPTGGITLETMGAYRQAGAYGVGIGSQLFDRKILLGGTKEDICRHFSRFRRKVLDVY